MKKLNFCIAVGFGMLSLTSFGQQSLETNYLEKLPNNLELDKNTRLTYHMVTDYLDYDLKGNFMRKTRVSGFYSTGLEKEQVKWNNVRVSQTQDETGSFPEGEKREYMEDFTYVPGTDAVSEAFFANISQADMHVRNLIWVRLMFDCFAYWDWDSLQLNNEYKEIEYGTMSEDVITDVAIDGQPENYVGYTVRYIILEKIK